MKRLFISLLLMMAVTMVSAQNALTIAMADGSQRIFMLNERPQLLWEGDNVILTTQTVELTIPCADFKGFTMTGEASDVKGLAKGCSRVAIGADGQLHATGLKAGSMLTVYDAAGRTLHQQTIGTSGQATVNLSAQPAGTYMVKIDHQPTLKIRKP
ncbi:MAG: T9SS type A sorting domain-containing protein [Prevotella sp.]|nr:T9SS type A sorting domain-containing protein [Prevotella sp.]